MSFEQLKYIVAVAKYNSFSIAAEKLFLSQSAISQSIIRLEHELNTQLFDRKTAIIFPTDDGQILINQAHKIIVELEYFEKLQKQLTTKKQSQFKLGVLKGVYLPFIAKLMLQSKTSTIDFVYIEADSLELVHMLENNEIDIAILALYPETLEDLQQLEYINSVQIELYIFMSSKSSFKSLDVLIPDDLREEKLVLYDGPFIKWFTALLQKQYGPLDIVFESKNIELLRESIRSNNVLSINTAAEKIHNPQLHKKQLIAIPFEHRTIPKYHLGIAYSKQPNSTHLEELAYCLNDSLQKLFT